MIYGIYINSKIKADFKDVVNIANANNLNIEIKKFTRNRVLDKLDKILPVYKSILKDFNGKLAMHAPFERVNPISTNQKVRNDSINRFNLAIDIAKDLNVKTIVFHSGIDTFNQKQDNFINWFIDNQVVFWQDFSKNLERENILGVIENTDEQNPGILNEIVNKVNSNKLKLCIDTGHVNHKTNMTVREWIEQENKNLYYMHLHNNYKATDAHNSLLKGTIDFKDVFNTLKELDLHPGLSLELTDYKATTESLDFLKKNLLQ